jgi:hypothetical protein
MRFSLRKHTSFRTTYCSQYFIPVSFLLWTSGNAQRWSYDIPWPIDHASNCSLGFSHHFLKMQQIGAKLITLVSLPSENCNKMLAYSAGQKICIAAIRCQLLPESLDGHPFADLEVHALFWVYRCDSEKTASLYINLPDLYRLLRVDRLLRFPRSDGSIHEMRVITIHWFTSLKGEAATAVQQWVADTITSATVTRDICLFSGVCAFSRKSRSSQDMSRRCLQYKCRISYRG